VQLAGARHEALDHWFGVEQVVEVGRLVQRARIAAPQLDPEG